MDTKSIQLFDALETWYRKRTNKRRTQGVSIAAGIIGSYALGPTYLAIACLGTVSILSWILSSLYVFGTSHHTSSLSCSHQESNDQQYLNYTLEVCNHV